MKLSLIVILILVFCPVLMATIGCLLPRQHRLARGAVFRAKPDGLYAIIREFARYPEWRRGVKTAELLPVNKGRVYFREVSSHGALTYVVLEDVPGEKLSIEIADDHLPFSGRWMFVLSVHPEGTRMDITEVGAVDNVLFRFMARFMFGYATTMETYLRDLARKLGQDVHISKPAADGEM
jgi:Polyketide cyclase / dehydrase and lipid transport